MSWPAAAFRPSEPITFPAMGISGVGRLARRCGGVKRFIPLGTLAKPHAQQRSLGSDRVVSERDLRFHAQAVDLVADGVKARVNATSAAGSGAAKPHDLARRAQLVEPRRLVIRQTADEDVRLPHLHRQRDAWCKQLEDLLQAEGAHPDGDVLLSLPGLGARLAARVLGEIGDDRARFPTAAALPCYAGTAPVKAGVDRDPGGFFKQIIAKRERGSAKQK